MCAGFLLVGKLATDCRSVRVEPRNLRFLDTGAIPAIRAFQRETCFRRIANIHGIWRRVRSGNRPAQYSLTHIDERTTLPTLDTAEQQRCLSAGLLTRLSDRDRIGLHPWGKSHDNTPHSNTHLSGVCGVWSRVLGR